MFKQRNEKPPILNYDTRFSEKVLEFEYKNGGNPGATEALKYILEEKGGAVAKFNRLSDFIAFLDTTFTNEGRYTYFRTIHSTHRPKTLMGVKVFELSGKLGQKLVPAYFMALLTKFNTAENLKDSSKIFETLTGPEIMAEETVRLVKSFGMPVVAEAIYKAFADIALGKKATDARMWLPSQTVIRRVGSMDRPKGAVLHVIFPKVGAAEDLIPSGSILRIVNSPVEKPVLILRDEPMPPRVTREDIARDFDNLRRF